MDNFYTFELGPEQLKDPALTQPRKEPQESSDVGDYNFTEEEDLEMAVRYKVTAPERKEGKEEPKSKEKSDQSSKKKELLDRLKVECNSKDGSEFVTSFVEVLLELSREIQQEKRMPLMQVK